MRDFLQNIGTYLDVVSDDRTVAWDSLGSYESVVRVLEAVATYCASQSCMWLDVKIIIFPGSDPPVRKGPGLGVAVVGFVRVLFLCRTEAGMVALTADYDDNFGRILFVAGILLTTHLFDGWDFLVQYGLELAFRHTFEMKYQRC